MTTSGKFSKQLFNIWNKFMSAIWRGKQGKIFTLNFKANREFPQPASHSSVLFLYIDIKRVCFIHFHYWKLYHSFPSPYNLVYKVSFCSSVLFLSSSVPFSLNIKRWQCCQCYESKNQKENNMEKFKLQKITLTHSPFRRIERSNTNSTEKKII